MASHGRLEFHGPGVGGLGRLGGSVAHGEVRARLTEEALTALAYLQSARGLSVGGVVVEGISALFMLDQIQREGGRVEFVTGKGERIVMAGKVSEIVEEKEGEKG